MSLKFNMVVDDVGRTKIGITEINWVSMIESVLEPRNVLCLESVVVETDIADGRIGPGG